MTALLSLHAALARRLTEAAPGLLPLLARVVFAGVFLVYFWSSARTKLGPGLLGFLVPSDGAYVQIFPRAAEAAGYDFASFGLYQQAVTVAGMWAEFLLPALVVLGLFTRLASLGMIGFVLVQTATDVLGHGVPLGRWFDTDPLALADARALWVLLLLVPVLLGPGALSLDRFLGIERAPMR